MRRRVLLDEAGAYAPLTTMLFEVAMVRPSPANFSEMVSAFTSARLVKVAIPPCTVAIVVFWSGPLPLFSDTVATVELSPVSRLPNESSSYTTEWVANDSPAVAVADGCVWITNWVAGLAAVNVAGTRSIARGTRSLRSGRQDNNVLHSLCGIERDAVGVQVDRLVLGLVDEGFYGRALHGHRLAGRGQRSLVQSSII